MRATVILVALADASKLPPYTIQNHRTTPSQNLPTGITVRCQPQGWITKELTKNCVAMVWN